MRRNAMTGSQMRQKNILHHNTVKAGQKLMTFSLEKIAAAGYSTTAVLLTNSDDYEAFRVVKTRETNTGEKRITL